MSLQDDPSEKFLADCTGDEPWLPHVQHMARGSAKAWHLLLIDGTLIHRGAGGPGRAIFFPFVPEKFRTPPNVVEPENVPELMFVEPEIPEVGEWEVDPPATSSSSDL